MLYKFVPIYFVTVFSIITIKYTQHNIAIDLNNGLSKYVFELIISSDVNKLAFTFETKILSIGYKISIIIR